MVDAEIGEKVYRVLESLATELPMEGKKLWERLERRTGCKVVVWDAIPTWRYARVPDTIHISYGDIVRAVLTCKDREAFITLYDFIYVHSFRTNKGWVIYYRV